MNFVFDLTGAIFFILKVVVVGIGKIFAFLVDAVVSLAGSDKGHENTKTGITPSRIDRTSYMYHDRFISMHDD